MKLRDRIMDFRRVPASELLPNPRNWRTHPEAQRNALRGVLAEIGIANAVLCRETPDGLQIIDGHCRAEIVGDVVLPVLVLDVTEEESDKLLATLDPLAAMAGVDAAKLDALLATVDTASDDVRALLDSLAGDAGDQSGETITLTTVSQQVNAPDQSVSAEPESSAKEIDVGSFAMDHKCPRCGMEFNDAK